MKENIFLDRYLPPKALQMIDLHFSPGNLCRVVEIIQKYLEILSTQTCIAYLPRGLRSASVKLIFH
jgi:hypothetical protein